MSDIQEEQKRLYKRAEENDYYFKKNNELSTLNTSLRNQRDNLQDRINKAIEFVNEFIQEDYYEKLDEYITHFTWNTTKEDLLNILQGSDKE